MNCLICGMKIVLRPSAEERAAKYGGTASDYTKLFTTHSHCDVEKRAKETEELMRRITGRSAINCTETRKN